MILCDTNIIIELYKNNSTVIDQLHHIGINNLAISVVTQAELYFGARNKRELQKIKRHLAQIPILPVDTTISNLFLQLMESYSLSHTLTIPDALLAATALVHKYEFFTLNLKDFRYIPSLKLYQPS